MKHIHDNDTSGFQINIESSHRMTVQFRCRQLNDLPLVYNLSNYGMGEVTGNLYFFVLKQRQGSYKRNSL